MNKYKDKAVKRSQGSLSSYDVRVKASGPDFYAKKVRVEAKVLRFTDRKEVYKNDCGILPIDSEIRVWRKQNNIKVVA